MKQTRFGSVGFAFGINHTDHHKKQLIDCVAQFMKIYQFEKKNGTVMFIHPDDENKYTCILDVGRLKSGTLFAKLIVVSCQRLKHKAKVVNYTYKQKFPENHIFDLLQWMITDISVMNQLKKYRQFNKEEEYGNLHKIYTF